MISKNLFLFIFMFSISLTVACSFSPDRTKLLLDLNTAKKQIDALTRENGELFQKLKTMEQKVLEYEDKLSKPLEHVFSTEEGIEVGPNWIRFPDSILFAPGKAELTKKGKSVLDKLVKELKKVDSLYLRIDGHTDSDPIKKTRHIWKTGSNFELGAYRALMVLLYLKKKGIPADHMHLSSWGEYKPLVPNTSIKNKKRNRRVEIFFYREKQ